MLLQDVTDYLDGVGHVLVSTTVAGVVTAVAVDPVSGKIQANSDFRKDGGVDGF